MPFDSAPQVTLASRIRQVFGPNGEGWMQSCLHDGDRHCLVGAIHVIEKAPRARRQMMRQIADLLPRQQFENFARYVSKEKRERRRIERFNDTAASFAEIAGLLDRLEEKELTNALR